MSRTTYRQVAEVVREATDLYGEVSTEVVDRQAAASIIGSAAAVSDRLTPETFLKLGIPAQDALLDAAESAESFGVMHEFRLQRGAVDGEHDDHGFFVPGTEIFEADDPYTYRIYVRDQLHALDSVVGYNRGGLMDDDAIRDPEVARKVRDSVLLAGNAIQAVLNDPTFEPSMEALTVGIAPDYLLGRANYGLSQSQREQHRQARATTTA